METKHTPGPWQLERLTGCDHDIGIRVTGSLVSGYAAFVRTYWPHPDQKAEQEANARLIAAAPELLEALQAYQTAKAMPTRGSASDFVWPEMTMRVPGDSTWGWICAKHGLGYQAGCVCCRDDLDRYGEEQDRKARYARDDALAAADAKATAAIAKATGSIA